MAMLDSGGYESTGMQSPSQSPHVKITVPPVPSREGSGFNAPSPEQIKGLSV